MAATNPPTALLAGRVVPTAIRLPMVSSDRYLNTVVALNVALGRIDELERRTAAAEHQAAAADALSRELFDQLTAAETEALRHALDRVKFLRLVARRPVRGRRRPPRRRRGHRTVLPF